MFIVTVEGGFSASHALLMCGGVRERRHNHEWRVRAGFSAEKLDEQGLAVDFLDIKRAIEEITGPLGGRELESMACFAGKNASAERVAVYIYEQIAGRFAGRANLEYVEVMEAEGCWVKYDG